MRPLKIGIDVTPASAGMGGVPRYTRCLVEALLRIDVSNRYILISLLPEEVPIPPSSDPSLASRLRRISCRQALPPRSSVLTRRTPASVKQWFRPITHAWVRFWFHYHIKPRLADLDIFHSSELLLWGPREGKHVVTVCDLTTLLFPKFHTHGNIQLHARKLTFAKTRAHTVIAISQHTKRDLITQYGIPPERIRVIYPGCDPTRYRPLTHAEILPTLSRYHLSPGYLLYVGTIEPRKNLARLIEACERLAHRLGRPPAPLVLVGAPGWKTQEIYRRIERSPLRSAIVLTGAVDEQDLPQLYNGASVFVYPSLYEGFGLPVLEAMACGIPVVTSNVSSLPEVIGDAGLAVNPEDPEALAGALHQLLTNESLRDALGQKGQQRAQQFSWDRTARETLRTYEETARA